MDPKRLLRSPRLSLPGMWVALAFVCLSFTPSLLPRSGLFQGFLCGVNGALGYGLGVLGAWVWRAFADRDARPPGRLSWVVHAAVAVPSLVVSLVLGAWWQSEVRALMDAEGGSRLLDAVVLAPTAVATFGVLVGLGRLLRALALRVGDLLDRWFGRRAARATGVAVVALATWLVVDGVLVDGFMSAADRSFSVADRITPDGVERPISPLRSGGPRSLVGWDELGREGRVFVARGPSADDIATFTGRPAKEPVRAYAGVSAADDVEERAALAVEDLVRAGGFGRSRLLVATTTGSGWVDPASVDTFEYLAGGDSAVVAMQYSYLPSWISYLVDQERAREAGRQLFDAVYERWSALPEDDRPELYVAGESLGSFGAEEAFSGEHDLRNRVDGALLVGPPSFNRLYRRFVDHRDPGTTELRPVLKGGRTVRFDDDPDQPPPPAGQPWEGTRVLYLVHASDPIVWWSPRLLTGRPDWLEEERGRDVLGATRWIPFVTFWQITADLPGATAVPAGHGHRYTGEYVDAWVDVVRPRGWTDDDVDRLRALVVAQAEARSRKEDPPRPSPPPAPVATTDDEKVPAGG